MKLNFLLSTLLQSQKRKLCHVSKILGSDSWFFNNVLSAESKLQYDCAESDQAVHAV